MRRLVLLIIFLVVVIGAVVLIKQFSHPNVGQINVGQAKPELSVNLNLSPKLYQGNHMQFNYPAGMTVRKSSALSGNDVEKASFKLIDVASWDLEIDVYKVNGNLLSNDSSLEFRLQHPEIYSPTSVTEAGQTYQIFTDTTAPDFNKVAFFSQDGLHATIALSGDDQQGLAPLQAAFNMVLSSWQWL